jgi:HSP20 family protein
MVRALPLFSPLESDKKTQQEAKMLYRMAATGSPIFGLRREIDRLFEDTFARDGSSFTPAVDIKENDNEIRLDLELPGLKPEDVEITAENGVLTVRGEKQVERKEGDESRFQIVERAYGTFMRTFQLPQGIDADQIKAEFNNGVLSLHIPKAALPQPKRIEISAGQQTHQAAVGSGNVSNQQSIGSTSNQKSTGNVSGQQSSQQSTGKSSGRQSTGTSQREREGAMAAKNR